MCLAGAEPWGEASCCPGAFAGPASRELPRPLSNPFGGGQERGGERGLTTKVERQRKWAQALGPAGSLCSEGSSSLGPQASPETATEPQLSGFVLGGRGGALRELLPWLLGPIRLLTLDRVSKWGPRWLGGSPPSAQKCRPGSSPEGIHTVTGSKTLASGWGSFEATQQVPDGPPGLEPASLVSQPRGFSALGPQKAGFGDLWAWCLGSLTTPASCPCLPIWDLTLEGRPAPPSSVPQMPAGGGSFGGRQFRALTSEQEHGHPEFFLHVPQAPGPQAPPRPLG